MDNSDQYHNGTKHIDPNSCYYNPSIKVDSELDEDEREHLVESHFKDIPSKGRVNNLIYAIKAVDLIPVKLILCIAVVSFASIGSWVGYERHLSSKGPMVVSDAFDPTAQLSSLGGSGAANSATGTLFDGTRIRSFYGQRYDDNHEFPTVHQFTDHCKRWGVVTTIFDPTEAITRVTDMPSWCLVIVADTKTPDDYMEKLAALQEEVSHASVSSPEVKEKMDRIFYFSVEKQKEWENINGPFGLFVRSTPWKHFCRKNLGYLFAILHGAEFMFDFDDDNFIKLDDNGMPLEILPQGEGPHDMVLNEVNHIMQGSTVFNHHPIMNASEDHSWARGFPIERIQDEYTQGETAFIGDLPFVSREKEIGVIQFLADDNPDIDALHRLSKPLPMTFPLEDSQSVLVPTHAYAPYNAQATIHTKKTFWATLLPGTVPGRVSDIWRSYFAQCIFADTGLQLVFSPPKIVQERNEHNYLGDFNAEQDLYAKSGKLVDFLSDWDSEHDTVPKRMEQLWIDLYERGYIEVDDVYAVQMWLGALSQARYEFPPLKRRFRNVAVMGQFNYADSDSVVDDIIFWSQKQRERVVTAVAAGPFTDEHMEEFGKHSIEARQSHMADKGYRSPYMSQKDLLLEFKDSPIIEGVLYAHDDGILNMTDLSEGEYPFPTDEIIASDNFDLRTYQNVRESEDFEMLRDFTFRIFPDGHLEDFQREHSFDNIRTMYNDLPLHQWEHTASNYCGQGLTRMAQDPEIERYLEEDGSLLFPGYAQADLMFIPTKYADEFKKAADLHFKHEIWVECAYPKMIDMLMMKVNASVRVVNLCTNWKGGQRGSDAAMEICLDDEMTMGFIHPYKIHDHGYEEYNMYYDKMQ